MSAIVAPAAPDPAALRNVDWRDLPEEAARQGVSALLHSILHECAEPSVPDDTRAELRAAAHATANQSLRQTGELLRVLDAFGRAHIEAVPFKGPAIAWSLYRSPGLRSMSDIDLWVVPGAFDAAWKMLVRLGYRPMVPDRRLCVLEAHFEHGDGGHVDLHWQLTPSHFKAWFPRPLLWSRLQTVMIHGRAVRTLGPEDLLRYLCTHAAWENWSCLRDLCDITRLLAAGVSVEAALADARRLGGERVLLLGLALARDLAGWTAPDTVNEAIAGDPALPRLVEQAQENLAGARFGGRELMAWRWQLVTRSGERTRLAWHLLRPNPLEGNALRLPRILYPAYFLLRPLRIASTYLVHRAAPARSGQAEAPTPPLSPDC